MCNGVIQHKRYTSDLKKKEQEGKAGREEEEEEEAEGEERNEHEQLTMRQPLKVFQQLILHPLF